MVLSYNQIFVSPIVMRSDGLLLKSWNVLFLVQRQRPCEPEIFSIIFKKIFANFALIFIPF